MMMRRAILVPVLLCVSTALRAEPATRPTTSAAEVRRQLFQLTDADALKRQDARQALMGLSRQDLPALKQAVKDAVPLAPSQRAVLKDIVTHIYLAGDAYMAEDDGFLGVRLANWSKPEERGLLSLERGVAVVSRIAGFSSFRMLQDGDVLLAIAGNPAVELNTPDELIENVRSVKAGQKITFEVLRQGKIVKVTITLDRKPTGLGGLTIDEFLRQRSERADELWDKEFAPLLGEKVG